MSDWRLTLGNRKPYRTARMSSVDSRPSRPLLYWGLAALAIIGGFIDLWRGGQTIAPILLVVGYCVLVPMAILK